MRTRIRNYKEPGKRRILPILAGAAAGIGVLVAARRKMRVASFDGDVVVITGGSRGLGLGLAAEFGRAGARLVLAARDNEELERATKQLVEEGSVPSSEYVLPVACDLTQAGVAKALIEGATRHFGKVDVLVNNASYIHVGPAESQPMHSYKEAMDLTYFAAVESSLAVLEQMLERGSGSIVNIASIGGKIPVPHLAPYCGAKFALVGFSETLHTEMRTRGIRVTTVIPGLLRTGSFTNAKVAGRREEEYEWFRRGSVTPGLSHTVEHAAKKIVHATAAGSTEVTIGPEVSVAIRIHGAMPATSQITASWVQAVSLPAPGGASSPEEAKNISAPAAKLTQMLAKDATDRHNEPPDRTTIH